MSNHRDAEVVLASFIKKMTKLGEHRGWSFREGIIDDFRKIGVIPKNLQLYSISKGNKEYSLFIKVSLSSPAFWGVSVKWQEILQKLKKVSTSANREWAVILLNRPEAGYLLSSDELLPLLSRLSVSGPGSGDIKIHERDVNPNHKFLYIEDLLEKLKIWIA